MDQFLNPENWQKTFVSGCRNKTDIIDLFMCLKLILSLLISFWVWKLTLWAHHRPWPFPLICWRDIWIEDNMFEDNLWHILSSQTCLLSNQERLFKTYGISLKISIRFVFILIILLFIYSLSTYTSLRHMEIQVW